MRGPHGCAIFSDFGSRVRFVVPVSFSSPFSFPLVSLLELLFSGGRAHGNFLGFGEVYCFCYLGFVVNLPPRVVVRFALIRVLFCFVSHVFGVG